MIVWTVPYLALQPLAGGLVLSELFGLPQLWGALIVTAVIVLRPDHASDEESVARVTVEIQDAVKERKGSVQTPKQVIVVESVKTSGFSYRGEVRRGCVPSTV